MGLMTKIKDNVLYFIIILIFSMKKMKLESQVICSFFSGRWIIDIVEDLNQLMCKAKPKQILSWPSLFLINIFFSFVLPHPLHLALASPLYGNGKN